MPYSQLATSTNILWKLIEANGFDPEILYRDAGINPDLLNKPGARISSSSVNQIWMKASEIIDDPCFGIHSHKYWHPSYPNISRNLLLVYWIFPCSSAQESAIGKASINDKSCSWLFLNSSSIHPEGRGVDISFKV